MKAPLNNSKSPKKIQKVQKAKVAGLSALAIAAISTSVVNAQSPYVQTYGKLKQEERAEEAAKQIQNSSKATTGSDKTKSTSTSTAASTSATTQKKSEMIDQTQRSHNDEHLDVSGGDSCSLHGCRFRHHAQRAEQVPFT